MKSAGIYPLARTITEFCHLLYERGLSPAYTGNVSARDDGELIWITPARLGMREVQPDNLALVRTDGSCVEDDHAAPSTELCMHLAIYRARPDVGAIVHAHPPKATAMAVARQPLEAPILAEMVATFARVPVVEFAPPASEELAVLVADGLKTHNAVLLSNHGMVAVGKTVEEAYYHLELVESFAEVQLLAQQFGGPTHLSSEQIASLQTMQ